MELAEIKILIDKYYDGETTLDEEAAIANYFHYFLGNTYRYHERSC
mgnify:CR=1 FL=1